MAPVGFIPAPVKFLRDLFGGDFETVDGTVTATTAGEQLVQNNPESVALTIINLGTDTVYIRPKTPASTTAGIELAPAGGSVSLIVRDDGPLPTYDWYVVANSGLQSVYFLRLQRYNAVSN